jgi:GT2 family glycosyltransferase
MSAAEAGPSTGAQTELVDGLSVVICAYTLDRWEELCAAIASVKAQTLAPVDVILVVDANEELLRRATAEFADILIVPNTNGHGLSGGRMTGSEMARGRLLAFLDDDAVAAPNWLAEFYRAYDEPDVLGVGGLVTPLWRGQQPRWLTEEFYWVIGCTYAGLPVDGRRIRNPIGANMSIRADVMRRTGGWALELGRREGAKGTLGTADETEFAIRAVRANPGGYWVFQPSAEVRHTVTAERTTWRYFVKRCRLEAHAKTILTGLTGSEAGLASERSYATRVLPRAVLRELAAGARGDRDGLIRAVAVVAGLLITGGEYARLKTLGRIREAFEMRSAGPQK